MNIRLIDEANMDPALDAEIRRGLVRCFPTDAETFSRSRAWHGSAPAWTAILQTADEVIAHVGVVDRQVQVGTEPVRVAGIQNVYVLPPHRGNGYTQQIMVSAMAEAQRRGFDHGLLFCIPELEKVYARCGWVRLPSVSVTRINENGQPAGLPGRNIAMYHPLAATWFPPGPIDLQGNDW